MAARQADLFETKADPAGFRYRAGVIAEADEQRLVAEFAKLEFTPFEFHGFLGKRRVVSFGRRYDFSEGGLKGAEDMPAFLLPAREAAANAFGLEPAKFQQVLLTEYAAGAAIGWHRDRPVFGDVIGISLLSSCTFRFRKKAARNGSAARPSWDRVRLICSPVRRAQNGNTVSRRSLRCAIPSRSARSNSGPVQVWLRETKAQ